MNIFCRFYKEDKWQALILCIGISILRVILDDWATDLIKAFYRYSSGGRATRPPEEFLF